MIFRFRGPKDVSADDSLIAPEVIVAILFGVGAVVGLILDYLIGR